jgi:Omp85 superfamily domain
MNYLHRLYFPIVIVFMLVVAQCILAPRVVRAQATSDKDTTSSSTPSSSAVSSSTLSSSTVSSSTAASRSLSGFSVIPFIDYAPETSLSFGGGGVYYFRTDTNEVRSRPSQVFFGARYSLRNQFAIGLYPDFYFNRESIRLYANIEASRFPDFFYGVSNNAALLSERELFTSFFTTVWLTALFNTQGKSIRNGLNLGARYEFRFDNILQTEPDKILARGALTGVQGGIVSGFGVLANFDSRDVLFATGKGTLLEARYTVFNRAFGSDYNFARFDLEWRQFFTLAETDSLNRHVLALNALFELNHGTVPFYSLGELGGLFYMRGFFKGQFRDNNVLLQTEYRFPIWWRFGGVVFAGAGDVGRSMDDFRLNNIKYSIGAGIRFALVPEERITLRLDIGYGVNIGTVYPYITFTEAF